MSAGVFTIGDTDFDDLDDDEEFLNEAFNFETNQPVETAAHTNDTGDGETQLNVNDCNDKRNLLRGKGSSANTFPISGKSGEKSLRPSSVNCGNISNENTNSKRMKNFSSNFSSQPPLKKQNCIKENRIPSSEFDQSISCQAGNMTNSITDVRNGIDKRLQVLKNSASDINIDKASDVRDIGHPLNGLRYTQNTRKSISYEKQKKSDMSSNCPNTPGGFNERNASLNSLRSTISASTNQQPEGLRFTKDLSSHLRGAGDFGFQNDSLYPYDITNCKTPATPNRSRHDSSINKFQSTGLTLTNSKTPKLRCFAKESLSPASLRTPAYQRKSVTPRRFPGPAGILPRLEAGQNLEALDIPLSETPKKKSSELCQLSHLTNGDNDEDFVMEPWTLMQERITKEFPVCFDSLASVAKKAASHELERGKVAMLAVLVKSFNLTGLDVSVVLKDPSGEMRGTLHRKVLEQRKLELGPGCGLFLKQVSVFSPSPRKHYLNVTPRNILDVFPANVQTSTQSVKVTESTRLNGQVKLQKHSTCSTPNKETGQASSFAGTNVDGFLDGWDEDDDELIEAINF